jgi:hypothetical protein
MLMKYEPAWRIIEVLLVHALPQTLMLATRHGERPYLIPFALHSYHYALSCVRTPSKRHIMRQPANTGTHGALKPMAASSQKIVPKLSFSSIMFANGLRGLAGLPFSSVVGLRCLQYCVSSDTPDQNRLGRTRLT